MDKERASGLKILILSLAVCVGAPLMYWTNVALEISTGQKSSEYTKTEGKVERVEKFKDTSSVTYSYSVNGKTFYNSREGYPARNHLIHLYLVGDKVPVYYDKDYPKEACLVPGLDNGEVSAQTAMYVVFGIAGVFGVLYGLSKLRAPANPR
jgi:hypothetical protein